MVLPVPVASAAAAPALAAQVLQIGRGGAAAAAGAAAAGLASELTSELRGGGFGGGSSSRGGGGGKDVAPLDDGCVSVLGLNITPEARSVLCMACAMALHYLAYSLARPSTLALFTSGKMGFAGIASAYPFAMGFVSPASLGLLMLYGMSLDARGPRAALRESSLGCALVLGSASALIAYLEHVGAHVSSLPFVRAVVGALFVFRESYVQLITSQHWSFMSSVLTPGQSSTWFSPISGLTSTASALAGMGVSGCVNRLGLTGTLGLAAALLGSSVLLTEGAYGISEKYGFNPEDEHTAEVEKEKAQAAKANKGGGKKGAGAVEPAKKSGMIKKASDLFARVPVLKALFAEILACQGVSTILNVCYVSKLSQTIEDDKERAGWSGKFFAIINVVSGFLQFVVLPPLMKIIEPSLLWRIMPLVIMGFAINLCLREDPTLVMVAGTFLSMKAMEFSARRMLDELVYVPLDFDSRYVGKEVIGVFGYRFGKSGMSLAVSALTSNFGSFGLKQLTYLVTAASAVWAKATWNLSNLVLTREEAEEAYRAKRAAAEKGGGKKKGNGGGGGKAKGGGRR